MAIQDLSREEIEVVSGGALLGGVLGPVIDGVLKLVVAITTGPIGRLLGGVLGALLSPGRR